MDDAQRKAVEERAYGLWQEAGCPEGQALLYWLRAEVELGVMPKPATDDPYVTLHELAIEAQQQGEHGPGSSGPPGGGADEARPPTQEPSLQRSIDEAVPAAERLPSGAEENPLSEHVQDAAEEPTPRPGPSTFEGGDQVAR